MSACEEEGGEKHGCSGDSHTESCMQTTVSDLCEEKNQYLRFMDESIIIARRLSLMLGRPQFQCVCPTCECKHHTYRARSLCVWCENDQHREATGDEPKVERRTGLFAVDVYANKVQGSVGPFVDMHAYEEFVNAKPASGAWRLTKPKTPVEHDEIMRKRL